MSSTICVVLEEGLEPSSLAALVPKTSAYTNSATPAFLKAYYAFVRPGGIEPPTFSLRGSYSTS